MTELEEKIADFDKRQETFETYTKMRQDSFETFMKNYIRHADEQMRLQREEMKEFKAETREQINKMDAKMDKLADKIDGLVKYVQSMAITSMIGLLGIAGSVVYFVYSVTPKP